MGVSPVAKVSWRRLVLRGFGCYAQEKELVLDDGLNVIVAANEQGKSTLVAGLVALLYGLPGSTDPSRVGKARYKSWHDARDFGGELEFCVDGEVYRVARNFDTDRVSLSRRESKGWVELAGGEHRARARRPNVQYIDAVRELVGIESPDLFTATFCLTQPLLREPSLDDDLVRLLSGATGSYQRGLESLSLSLRNLTRYTRDLGVTPGNQRQDRHLEQLETEVTTLQQKIQQHRELLDALPAVQEELGTVIREYQEVSGRLKQREQSLRVWGEWRTYRLQYDTRYREQQRLDGALDRLKDLVRREESRRSHLASNYPELLECPAETGETLGRLQTLSASIAQLKTALVTAEGELAAHQREIARLQELVRTEYAAVDGRPELTQKHRELLLRLDEKEQLERRLAAARQRGEGARAQLAGLWPWAGLGSAPSALLPERRRMARALLDAWNAQLANRRELDHVSAELQGALGWFDGATPEARSACRDWPTVQERVWHRLREARGALEQARARIDAYQDARRTWEREFGELVSLGEEAARAMDKKLAFLDQRQKLEQQAARASARPVWRQAWVWAAVLAVLFLVVSARPYGVAAAVALAAAVWLAHARGSRGAGPAEELAAVDRALHELVMEHAFLISWNQGDLIRAQERYRLCRAQEEVLAAQSRGLPSPGDLAALQEQLAAAEAAERQLLSLTADARQAFGDVAGAYARWAHLTHRRAELERIIGDWNQRQLGGPTRDAHVVPVEEAQEHWREMAVLAGVAGTTVQTVAEAATWMAGLGDDWWKQAMRQAQEWEEATADLQRALRVEQEVTGAGEDGVSPLARLESTISLLRARVAPFDESHTTEYLQALVSQCQRLQADLQAEHGLCSQARRRKELLEAELTKLQSQLVAGAVGLEPVLAATGGNLDQSMDRWRRFAGDREQWERALDELNAFLRSHDAATPEELRLKVVDAANQAGIMLRRWQDLVLQNPGLPEADLREDVEDRYRSLQEEVAELARKAEAASERVDFLRRKQAELVGAAPFNLAAAEDRLAELRQQREQVRLEVSALSLAYHALQQAAQDFQASHRQRLAQATSTYFASLSGVDGRRVEIDEGFHLWVVLDGGRDVLVDQLSQGAQDQLFLALRLAISDLLSGDYVLPFIFDDPFLNFDAGRLEHTRQAVLNLSYQRQVLLFSHRAEFSLWQQG